MNIIRREKPSFTFWGNFNDQNTIGFQVGSGHTKYNCQLIDECLQEALKQQKEEC